MVKSLFSRAYMVAARLIFLATIVLGRRGIRLRWLLLIAVQFFSTIALGQTLQFSETFTGTDPNPCVAPPAKTTFLSTDASVNIYFSINGLRQGDTVKVLWVNPAGATLWHTSWNPITGGSSECFWFDLNIATYISPSWGTWQAQVTVNDNKLGAPTGFQVNPPSTQITCNAAVAMPPGVRAEGM